MGPHSFERGNLHEKGSAIRKCRCGASMGPHSFERGNQYTMTSWLRYSMASLQWGLTLSSEETVGSPPASRLSNMMSFNGASLFRARKQPRMYVGSHSDQRSGFNGASLFRARKPRTTMDKEAKTIPASLQWGLTLSSEETSGNMLFDWRHLQRNASMGPHSFERGNSCVTLVVQLRANPACFNGASLFRARKPSGGWARMSLPVRHRSFNGASLFRARKLRPEALFLPDIDPSTSFNGASLFRARKLTQDEFGVGVGIR